jgi:RNA polymerase primary sigma factor
MESRGSEDQAKRKTGEGTMSVYLKEINRIPLLSREKEQELLIQASEGNEEAKKALIKSNLRFVVRVAKRYTGSGLAMEDLVSEGNVGLMAAVERFDPSNGCRFISYAVWWIRQAISKMVYEYSSMIRLPAHRASALLQVRRILDDVRSEGGLRTAEIARQIGKDEKDVTELLSLPRSVGSLDVPLNGEKDAPLLRDCIGDKRQKNLEAAAIDNSLKEDIKSVLTTLSVKESDILQRRFGLNGKKAMTLGEIGSQYRLSRQRIRQIEKNALQKLRHSPAAQNLQSYIA